MPDRVKSFRQIDSRKDRQISRGSREDRPRARPGFVKSIRNRLRKVQNLIWSRPSRAETGLAGERMELDSQNKSTRDRIMRSKSFDTQEVREIDRKEAGESRGFPILWKRIIEDVFQMQGKECKDQEKLNM